MRTYLFDVAEHEEYGEIGLRPSWYPNGDPLQGMAAAHDILEHFPNDKGDTVGELMALGAALFIRGDGRYIHTWHGSFGARSSRPFDETGDIPADFPMIWDLYLDRNEGELPWPPVCRNRELRSRVRKIMFAVRKLMQDEKERWENSGLPTISDYRKMEGWLAHGYTKAKKRYARTIGGAASVAGLFQAIESECNKLLKQAEEGDKIKVTVNLLRCDYNVNLVERKWD